MSLRHPFQKLCFSDVASEGSKVLFAASGPYICSFNVSGRGFLSRWPNDHDDEVSPDEDADGARPTKRPRLADSRQSSEESVEIVSERAKGQRRKPKVVITKLPNVSHLLATRDGKHLIAVTADDKCIRVFEMRKSGRLKVLSERCMPKRLCAITMTSNQTTIVAGDKFGDVYSLPLLVGDDVPHMSPTPLQHSPLEFKPSATELTVHTKGNLDALRQQREQKILRQRKEGPTFEHKLLLGHVSLLTDVTIGVNESAGQLREYILTADRDEHIRVSRGIPQTHIIESYCSGHKEFVSKLCTLPWQQSLLVTGSGESSLKVFQWIEGKLLTEIAFGDLVEQAIARNSDLPVAGAENDARKLAVSGIWTIQQTFGEIAGLIVVALEGLPLLLSFTITATGKLTHHQTLTLSSNALDVTIDTDHDHGPLLIVSVDTIHKPGSCKEYNPDQVQTTTFFDSFVITTHDKTNGAAPSGVPFSWEPTGVASILDEAIQRYKASAAPYEIATVPQKTRPQQAQAHYSPPGEFLYSLENLRKKRGAEAAAIEDGEEEEEATGALTHSASHAT